MHRPCPTSTHSFGYRSTAPSNISSAVAISSTLFIDTQSTTPTVSISGSVLTSVSTSTTSSSACTSISTISVTSPHPQPTTLEYKDNEVASNIAIQTSTIIPFTSAATVITSTASDTTKLTRATLSSQTCMTATSSTSSSHCDIKATAALVPARVETATTTGSEFDIVHHNVKDTLLIVSTLLSLMVRKNDSQYNPHVDPITLFHSRAVPRISIESYLARILQFIPFTNEVLLNVLVYLDRIGGLSGMDMVDKRSHTSYSNRNDTGSDHPSSSSRERETAADGTSANNLPRKCVDLPAQTAVAFPSSTMSPSSSPPPSLLPSSTKHVQRCPDSSSFSTSIPCRSTSAYSEPLTVQKHGREEESHCSHPQQQQHTPSVDATPQRAFKKLKQEHVSPEHQPPTAIDVQCTLGGSTPAPTPILTVASNGFRINSFNIHRLLITCLMVAAKFTSDLFYSNARYAKVGGLSLLELNQLELEFLFTTRFELNVKIEELQRVGNALLRFKSREMIPVQQAQLHVARQQQLHVSQALQRGVSSVVTASTTTTSTTSIHKPSTAAAGSSKCQDESRIMQQQQQQKKSRSSIPSPTSPKNGPMSDRPLLTSVSSLSSVLPSLSMAPTGIEAATVASSSNTVTSGEGTTTVVVASRINTQRQQLLSPPEEKQRWSENEVQMAEESIHEQGRALQGQEASSSSTSSSASMTDFSSQ